MTIKSGRNQEMVIGDHRIYIKSGYARNRRNRRWAISPTGAIQIDFKQGVRAAGRQQDEIRDGIMDRVKMPVQDIGEIDLVAVGIAVIGNRNRGAQCGMLSGFSHFRQQGNASRPDHDYGINHITPL
jgi:hypothetical protein